MMSLNIAASSEIVFVAMFLIMDVDFVLHFSAIFQFGNIFLNSSFGGSTAAIGKLCLITNRAKRLSALITLSSGSVFLK